MHSNKSWDDLTQDRDAWMERAQKAEGDLHELGEKGALGRLAGQLAEAESASARQKEKYGDRVNALTNTVIAKERAIADLNAENANLASRLEATHAALEQLSSGTGFDWGMSK